MAHGPIDPVMVGLWRAESEKDGNRTIMVWRIPPDGYAVLTPVVTMKGKLEADAGLLKISPRHGEDFEFELPDAGPRQLHDD